MPLAFSTNNTTENYTINVYNDQLIAENFLFLLFLLFLLMASVYIGNYAVMIFAGILFIFAPFAYDYTFGIMPTSLSILAFMLIGVAIIFQAISYYLTEKKAKR